MYSYLTGRFKPNIDYRDFGTGREIKCECMTCFRQGLATEAGHVTIDKKFIS